MLAAILRERFDLPDVWYGALLAYAALTTLLPSLTLAKPLDLDATDLSVPQRVAPLDATSSDVHAGAGEPRQGT